ncbi:hypothetical protein Q5752_004726 [Cryptotrichosporon argae]
MSIVLRSSALRSTRAVARQQTRGVAFNNVVDKTMPVNTTSKVGLAIKMTIYTVAGFGLPFFASWHQQGGRRRISSAAASRVIRMPSLQAAYFASTSRSYATAPSPISASDPSLARAQELLERGTRALEDGDMENARESYRASVGVQPTSGAWFNLGVCEYQLGKLDDAVKAWQASIALEPSADAYTNIGSAHMMARPPRPAEAVKALTSAMQLAPEDPEIQFNLAAILESTGKLDTALALYRRAHAGGIERAAANIRNLGGKILAQRVEGEKEGKAE